MEPANILLIEDNEGDIILTLEAIKEGDWETNLAIARDGEEGLDYLHQRGKFSDSPRPDLILLDLNMPKIGGKELLAQIRKDKNLCSIPTIVLTTSNAEKDIIEAYQLSANCYIVKPVSFDDFTNIFKEVKRFWFSIARLPSVRYN